MTLSDLQESIGQFGVIEDGVYRGLQPTDEQIRKLKDFGIRTVINFRHEKPEIEHERKVVESLGMRYVSLPWRIQVHPKNPVMDQFLEEVQKRENGPFFIHCRRGAERTGVADAVYREYVLKMPRETAWEKAMAGFHTLFYWRPFIKKRLEDFQRDLDRKSGAAA